MSEKPSPSSTITSGASHGSIGTPQSLARNNSSSHVVIVKQPPTHVFPDEWFEVIIDVDIKGKGSPFKDADFAVTLHNQKSGRPTDDDDARLIVVPVSPIRFSLNESPSKRKRTLRCKIRLKEVLREKPTAYFIQLSLKDDGQSGTVDILPGSTNQIRVVNYKINLSYEEDWDSIWYKDEGGRDKCMSVTAALLDKDGRPCVGEQVPLQLTLYYDTGQQPVRVSKQDILRTLGSVKLFMDKRTGKATLRFRVEDVSKNHQGQSFRVEVGVDARSKGFYDVAPAFTPEVSVRSKRNKRQRASAAASTSEAARYGSPVGSQARGQHGFPTGEQTVGLEAAFSGTDIHRLREATRGVIQWTEEVVSGLFPLQWQVIGYAQNPDGGSDFSRPYHSMQNPNEYIARVLSTYNEATRAQLRFLMSTIERAGSSQQGEESHSLARLPASRMPDYDTLSGLGPPGGSPYPMDQRLGSRGLPMQAAVSRGSFLPGAHPLSDVFRDKGEMSSAGFPTPAAHVGPQPPMQLHAPMLPHGQSLPGAAMHRDMGSIPGHLPSVPEGSRAGKIVPLDTAHAQSEREFDVENRENEVAYVLAKQFKAMRTGERLGFPAYSESKEILGFYRESSRKVGVGQFLPIARHREDFGPLEVLEATQILNEAIASKSEAVYALKDWGSISSLIDHALVYDWSKDIGAGATNSGSSSGD